MKRLLKTGLIAILLSGCALAWAQSAGDPKWRGYTQGEWALMPEWCIDSQDGPYGSPEGGNWMNKSPRAPTWVAIMGQDFWHMHHYCRGLRAKLRLQRPGLSTLDRNWLIRNAISEFEYIFNNCKPTMPLMPEVYLKLGEVHLINKDLGSAQAAFEQSRRLKPDYWPAYDRWIGVLIDLKQWERARQLTQEGLSHMPGEPNLSARLQRIESATGRRSTQPAATESAQAPTLR